MRRCRVLIPDAGPFNSLWVANALELLLKLDLPITLRDDIKGEFQSLGLEYAPGTGAARVLLKLS